MALISINKRNNVALQLSFMFIVSALLLVAHARDIRSSSSSNKVDDIKKDAAAIGVVQALVRLESSDDSSSSSNAFEASNQEEENLSGTSTAPAEEGMDLLVMDYTPARKKTPIHN